MTRDGELAPVPLTGVTIDAEISGFCARVVVTQRYVNRETTPIEAVYLFPLEEGAAVCGFEAIVDDTLVVGEVMERDKAFERYDDAMAAGHGAFLLDEERPDVFQASVGNLPPGKEVLLRLTYVTELTTEPDGLRFAIPTTVSPRYAPAEDRVSVGRSDAETLNPPRGWAVPYGLNLSVRLAMPEKIVRVESTSHPIAVMIDGPNDAHITLSQTEPLDRDFVLSVYTQAFKTPCAWIERQEDGEAAVALAFVPTLSATSVPAELIFLVDRSGSMDGASIEEVRNALQLCLRSMIPGCFFNIVGFGSTFHTLFAASRLYDDKSLAEAAAHIAALRADLGGTEILPALTSVLEQPRHEGLLRQVIVLTDGEVSNTDAVLALAAKHTADARVFTFGIGAGASHHLVRGLARAGGGFAEFIYPGERIEAKVLRHFARLLSPAATDVRVDWDGLTVTQAPDRIPPVFAGERLLVYGFLKGPRAATARLEGLSSSGSFAFDVQIDPGTSTQGRTVATLAARARIRELEESAAWTPRRGSRQVARTSDRVSQEIIALSTKYGLMSRETSFVAVERRDTPVEGDVQLRRVPIALTTGWGGLNLHFAQIAATGTHLGAAWSADTTPALHQFSFEAREMRVPAMHPAYRRIEPARASRAPRQSPASQAAMHALVALQRADGTWDLDDRLAAVVGRDLTDMKRAVAGAHGDRGDASRAWATALALAWLREHATDLEDEWRLLGRKARKWLDDVTATPADGGAWLDAARLFLRG